jgi:hypothetical protein
VGAAARRRPLTEQDDKGNQDDWLLIRSSAWVDSNAIAAVPEPANQSLWLGGLALLGVGATARRRARA